MYQYLFRRAQAYHDYLRAIRDVDTNNYDRSEVYGFYMNVYNAFAIKMILDHSCDSSLGRLDFMLRKGQP